MDDAKALSTIIEVLKQLDLDTQRRVLDSVQTFLGLPAYAREQIEASGKFAPIPDRLSSSFSVDRSLSPKEFLRDKNPSTDVERVTCLGYYLAHFRDKPHFKTVDISALNTEAAQPKLSNASVAVDNARAAGYLVPATKGNKQVSIVGEKFVELLPDRDAAREAIKNLRKRRSPRRTKANR